VLRCKGMRLERLGHFDADGNRIDLFGVRQ
jgi:hypothetical protein